MNSERAEQPAAPEFHHTDLPGKTLAAQREAMGWSVEQVADQLKLAVRQIIALEADNYASLPSPAVVRGFVRAYAKILKIDPAPLVAKIEMEAEAPIETAATSRREKPATFSEVRFPSHGKRRKLSLGWIAVVVAAVAGTAVAWHLGMLLVPGTSAGTENARGSAASMTELAPPASMTTPAPASAPQETPQNSSVPLISVPANGAQAAPATGTRAAPATTAPAAGAPAAPAVTAATMVAAPAAAGPNALVINVRTDSWIEVRPAKGGAALISRLVKGGSTETVQVNEPVNLVVGNPPGVSASLRGAAVELSVEPGKTISRVSLK